MRVALDSNVLLYAAGVARTTEDQDKAMIARSLIEQLSENSQIILPFQVLGECYHVLRRNGRRGEDCRSILESWRRRFALAGSDETAFLAAIDLATDHGLQFWDSLIISVAAGADCRLLISEDLQPGFSWRGVVVVNPFANELDLRLARLLENPV